MLLRVILLNSLVERYPVLSNECETKGFCHYFAFGEILCKMCLIRGKENIVKKDSFIFM